ncbi:hypothetical protein LOF14_00070 [Klebsiella variicola subsp. variicola]|nr:hypothetical protein LOF14_00070 [Klebsiella variicola subsp. variicola]
MAPEKQKAIFEAFSRADSSTTRRHGGTWVKLTISARLVNPDGRSNLTVESQPGAGSEFASPCRWKACTPRPPVAPAEPLQQPAGAGG